MVRRLVVFTFLAALAVFCVVQDRVTAAGAERYARMATDAIARGRAPATPVDTLMRPVIRRSVRWGLTAAAAVLVTGGGAALMLARSTRG